jgi:hypothetical protein
MNAKYYVAYCKMGDVCKDSFQMLQEAIEDYQIKLETHKQGFFDDRFVLHIEDSDGKVVNVKV